ncbi:MAG: hypothetical protein H6631_03300 [Anaerolineaceae bacterium]|nr:hypothetical protein [Anaerolineaceae bacterium]MCB9099719.1 hypothetical protein [Anaerolineales bacterium]
MRRLIREVTFQLVRHDLARFLQDHEAEMIQIFHEEIQKIDDEIDEEAMFIDIKMVPLGEVVLKAALRAIRRFLVEKAPDSLDD